jgi:hypothetical protein
LGLRCSPRSTSASSGFDIILLSSETFAYWTDAEVRTLAALLRGAPASIVFYCRRWSGLLPAHWREGVKHGSAETMSDFVGRYLETPSASGIVDFAQVLARFAGVFGAESLRVASYNAVLEAGEDLLTNFCRSFLGWRDPPDNGLGRQRVARHDRL